MIAIRNKYDLQRTLRNEDTMLSDKGSELSIFLKTSNKLEASVSEIKKKSWFFLL